MAGVGEQLARAVVANGETLGTPAVISATGSGDFVIFSDRRWKVLELDDRAHKLFAEDTPAGRVPKFYGDAAPIHDVIAVKLNDVYGGSDVPGCQDDIAKRHLEEGRVTFGRAGLRGGSPKPSGVVAM